MLDQEGSSWLIRAHNLPRLTLFTPSRAPTCPIDEDKLTGVRKTKLKGMHPNAEEVKIEDDFKESDEPNKTLQERWTGETWFELKPEARPHKTPAKLYVARQSCLETKARRSVWP